MAETALEMFRLRVERDPSYPFVYTADGVGRPYALLSERVDALAAAMRSQGAAPGDVGHAVEPLQIERQGLQRLHGFAVEQLEHRVLLPRWAARPPSGLDAHARPVLDLVARVGHGEPGGRRATSTRS